MPINFQIETDSDAVFKKVISTLINNLGKDKLITDYLVQFSMAQIEDNKNWDPEQTLIDFIKEINKEGVRDLINQLNDKTISDFDVIKKQLKAITKEFETYLKSNGENALKIINEKQLTANAFASGGSGIYNFYVKLATLKTTSQAELFGANVVKTLEQDKWHGGKASVDEKAAIDTIKIELANVIADFLAHHHWHATQQFSKQSGKTIVTFQCGINRELLGWLFQWLYNIKILEPPILKDYFEKTIHEISAVHQAKKPLVYRNIFGDEKKL